MIRKKEEKKPIEKVPDEVRDDLECCECGSTVDSNGAICQSCCDDLTNQKEDAEAEKEDLELEVGKLKEKINKMIDIPDIKWPLIKEQFREEE
jgi:hypothetical protein